MKTALTRVINDYARRQVMKENEEKLSGEDVGEANCRYFYQTPWSTVRRTNKNEVETLKHGHYRPSVFQHFDKFLMETLKSLAPGVEKGILASNVLRQNIAREVTRKSGLEISNLPEI